MYLAMGEGASWTEQFAHMEKRVRALEEYVALQKRRR
jgi:hypothetical protein